MIARVARWTNKHLFLAQDRMILDQQYKLLDAKFEKLKYEQELENDSTIIVTKLHGLLKQRQSWTCLSQIELYLISLYSREQIELELKIKLLEAREKLKPIEVTFFETEIDACKTPVDRKILLNNLNEKLQLVDDIENLQNTYVALTRIRTSFLFFLAMVFFFAVDQLPALSAFFSIVKGQKSEAVITAMSAGWLGTCFSMLIGLKNKLTTSSLQELKVIHRIDYIFSRTIIGIISGLIVFYFFQARLLTGSMFPVLDNEHPSQLLNEQSAALLTIWCFISGFAEKLVPDLLAQTEKKLVPGD